MLEYPRRLAFAASAICSIVAAAWVAHHYRHKTVLVAGPMVQQVTPTSFTVVWQTHPSHAASISFGSRPAAEVTINKPDRAGVYSIATYTGGSADTTCWYEITAGDRILARHKVRTAPAEKRPTRFIAFGDSGVGGWSQWRLARRMWEYEPDLLVHTGDILYPRGRMEDSPGKFFAPYGPLLATLPVYPCMGNHDYRTDAAQPFLDAFVLPRNGPSEIRSELCYWFDRAGARFVCLDSNHDEPLHREVISPWLDEVLTGAANRWKIVYFHEPIYTQGRYPPSAKLLHTIVPVMERHNVDLVLCGHNHMYERSHAIRDGRNVEPGQGTVYITTGAGGANLAEARLPMPETIAVWNDREHSFTMADVGPDRIFIRQINGEGMIIDECDVLRNRPAESQPAS